MSNVQRHTALQAPGAIKPFYRWGGVLCFFVLATLAHADLQAQTLYRIVGPEGRITFSDKPPAAAAKVTELSADSKDSGAANAALPYELRQVAGKYPVTLFTTAECAPCDEGRTLLRSRGIPFAEKTVTTRDDIESLQRLADSTSLPLLTMGAQQIKGYSVTEWTQYLHAAGYPEKSQLPASYRYAEPTPLVAIQAPAAASPATPPAPVNSSNPAAPAPANRITPANPAGIQF